MPIVLKTTIQIPIWLMDGNVTLQPASMNNYYLQLHVLLVISQVTSQWSMSCVHSLLC